MSDFELLPADLTSATWLSLKQHLQDRLATLRAQNDTEQTPEKTARLRGQIAEVKRLLALGEPRQLVRD